MTESNIPETALEAIRYFGDPMNCHDFLVSLRWANGVTCPHCSSKEVGKFSGKRMVSNCKSCKKQFTVKVGTIFEDSALPLTKWIPAVWLIVNAKNGISSCELHRSLGVTQKTAWHMGHRIRKAIQENSFIKMGGTVEVDETFIGGAARFMHKTRKKGLNITTGPGTHKTAVQGLLERHGKGKSRVILKVMKNRREVEATKHIKEYVLKESHIYTDKLASYQNLGAMDYTHKVIDHAERYVDGVVHTNGLENFWTLLKRTVKGTHVHVAPFHLHRYLDDQAYRFNERAGSDSDRFLKAMRSTKGNRLSYAKLTGKA